MNLAASSETAMAAGFLQTPLAGVVVGALLTTLSTVMLWLLSRTSDSNNRARALRLESGIESIKCAWRLRDACNELIAANVGIFLMPKPPREAKEDRDRRWQAWQDASEAMGQQLYLARALGTPHVWIPLKYVASLEREYMPSHHMPHPPDEQSTHFQEAMDHAIEALADAVREDARVMDGVRRAPLKERWHAWRERSEQRLD